jgi:hypothetical protein
MSQEIINIGQSANDKSGDPIRTAFSKVNANFTELYGNLHGVIPTPSGHNGEYLTNDGTNLFWNTITIPEGTSLISTSTTAPTSPTTGELWYDPVSGRLYVWFDSTWVDAAPELEYTLPKAGPSELGGIIVGDNLSIDGNGRLSALNAYTLPIASSSVLGGIKIGTGLVISGDGTVSASINQLGNLTISDQTITGHDINGDIVILPNGTGSLSTNSIKIPVGTLISGNSTIIANIANLVLAEVIAHSSTTPLTTGEYGITNGIPAPWTVYSFTTTPSPILQINDIIAGAGIPVNSTVVFVGSNTYATYVIVNTDFGTTEPASGTVITTARSIVNAGLSIQTEANTDITLNAGSGGNIVPHSDILPYTTNIWRLGSPAQRFKELWLGAGTLYVLDETLGVDLAIGARDGNLYVEGGAGLQIGNFLFSNNKIGLVDTSQDLLLGTTGASGKFVINRSTQINSGNLNVLSTDFGPNASPLTVFGTSALVNTVPLNNAGTMTHWINQEGNPCRLVSDSFGTGTYNLLAGRMARGTLDTPTATQSGDVMMRLAGNGFGATGFNTLGVGHIDIQAAENYTDTSKGSKIVFALIPTGTNTLQSNTLTFDTSGIEFLATTSGGTGGITFPDSTRQTSAWTGSITSGQITGNIVTSITAGTGLQQNTTTGAITLNATGVQNVYGTQAQVYVTDAGGKNLTLSLPQNIDTSSNPTFNNLTVNNLTVNGTQTINTSASINGKILYLASNATLSSQIDGGGVILGTGSFARSILYSLSNDWWDTDGSGINTQQLTATNATLSGNIRVAGTAHLGTAYEGIDYPNSDLQIDANVNSYVQLVQQNHSNGTNASSDFVAENDLGTDGTYFIDMGINGSTYNGTSVGWTVSGANDAYLYNSDGNLTIGTATATKTIAFHTGGTLLSNIRATLSDTGLNVVGDVTAATLHGTLTGNVTGNLTGNVTGNVSGNAGTVTNGVYTSGTYNNPNWLASLAGSKITGYVANATSADNATTVTNGVYTTGSYSNPTWIASLAYTKITGAPTAVSSFTNDANYATTSQLTWNSISNKPTTIVYTSDTGTVTNTMLAGNISNDKLLNNSITINGTTINLGGSGTVTASANTLTGTTLNSSIVNSSLTSIGTLTNLTVTNTITGSITGNAGTVTNGVYTTDTGSVTNTMLAGSIANNKIANPYVTINGTQVNLGASGTVTAAAGTLTGTTLNSTVINSNLQTVGTLTNLTVSNPISGSITGNAATVTNGVYTTNLYSNPSWITDLASSKITGATMTITAGTGLSGGGSLALGGSVTLNNTGVLSVNGQAGAVTNIATLTGGYLTTSQIPPSLLGGVNYQGTWDATANSPSLADGTGTQGYEYVVTTAGTHNFGHGNITFNIGDFVIYSGTVWQRIPSGANVTSFNTRTGAITLQTSDVTGVLTTGSVTNTMLANSKVTIGSTDITLGNTVTTIAGLTSVTSTAFVGNVTGNVSGNAGTVTNGVYTSGSYADPTWLTSLSYSKLSGAPTVYSSVYLGSTSVPFNRASGALSLSGVSIDGNAGTATILANSRNINGTAFNGSADITITAVNPYTLTIGTGLTGTSYNGSGAVTIAVDNTAVMLLSGTQTIAGTKTFSSTITGSITGNAGTVTNGVYTTDTGSVTNTMLAGSIANNKLTNSSVTVTAGTGMSGGGTVSLGGTITLTNAGVTSAVAGTGINVSSGTGAVTITNTGVTSINSTLTGAVTGIITSSDTGTVTNTMLAGSIANNKLTNSSVTIGTTSISLGGTSTTLSGLTSVSATTFTGALTGNVTGNVSGTASTITGTYGGTLTSSQVTSALGFTPIQTAVTSLTGTANQIAVSASTGAVTLSLPNAVTMPGSLTLAAGTASVAPLTFQTGTNLSTAVEGAAEFDGKVLYFTSNNAERGIVKNPQVFVLNANHTLTNQASVQSLLGKGVTISSGLRYYYRILYTVYLSNSSRLTSAPQFAVGGTAVLAQNTYWVNPCGNTSQTTPTQTYQMSNHITSGFATGVTIANTTSGAGYYSIIIDGNLDCTTGGTLIPYFGLSTSTPGSSSYIQAGATMEIYPMSAAGADTSVGTWA